MTDQSTPLWKLLFNEDCKEIAACERHVYASMIEAVRDRMVPEEAEYPMGTCGIKELQREERQRLRAQLTEQARIAREGK